MIHAPAPREYPVLGGDLCVDDSSPWLPALTKSVDFASLQDVEEGMLRRENK